MDLALTDLPSVGSTPYHRALDYLFARTTGKSKYGLERTEALLARLGNPHRRLRALHVAGTNGKGSVCAILDAVLRGRGLRVGRYTSPHLVDFRERILIDGRAISEDEVVQFIERWTPTVEQLGATFFEATTAMAFAAFARGGVDAAVIETGLGGRLDATNVLTPLVAAVTSIGIEHTEYLGDTIESISFEKAGIFKRGVPAVIGERDAGTRELLARFAAERGARPVHVVADELRLDHIVLGDHGTEFTLAVDGRTVGMQSPLAGVHQAYNAATALAALRAAGDAIAASTDDFARSLADVRLPGRFQRVGNRIFDVAHNPDGAAVVAETMRRIAPPRPVTCVFGVLGDKDWRRMLDALAGVVDEFVLTTPPTAPPGRIWDASAALAYATGHGYPAELHADFDDALRVGDARGRTVLITGSFHTVGDAMARLQVDPLAG